MRAQVYVAVRHLKLDPDDVANAFDLTAEQVERIAAGRRPTEVQSADPEAVRLAANGATLRERGEHLGLTQQDALLYLRRFEIPRSDRPPPPPRPRKPGRRTFRDAAMVAQLREFVELHEHQPAASTPGLGRWLSHRRQHPEIASEGLRAAIADAGADLDAPVSPGRRYSETCRNCTAQTRCSRSPITEGSGRPTLQNG